MGLRYAVDQLADRVGVDVVLVGHRRETPKEHSTRIDAVEERFGVSDLEARTGDVVGGL